ncbi:YhcH/YjgK/YiaL family protein [Halpernia humi]|uniref:YhcH/YjgK/YiaL family protein n=1 Tax=Halpernia humi TaxID=493375 RepID=A0A1H6A270_9FLAO|nr:YhcH/YjgK/YiaL family protein [Halpernia humi]SEG42829.1 YhcH/YjgK/YiaL family protein [Halpernia humi]
MILDKLENINRYSLDLAFVSEDLQNEFRAGRFEIAGEEKFGIGLQYETTDGTTGLWEGHKVYLDIHVILEGEEIVEIADINQMTLTKPYEMDYHLFQGEKQQSVILSKGYFLILFPNEIHKTGVNVERTVNVKKNVYKLLL